MNNNSRETLRMVTQNDPSLTELVIFDSDNNHGVADGKFYSDIGDDYSTLGVAIANNTHLEELRVLLSDGLALDVTNREFYDGLHRNTSISNLYLWCNHITIAGGVGQEILEVYQRNNSHLTDLSVTGANLQSGGDRVVVDALRSCRNLQQILLGNCSITDEQLLPIVDAIRGLRVLEDLDLHHNNIGNTGCDAIAALLEDPNCNMHTLGLEFNAINNEGATTIANSLSNNNKLQHLYLGGNQINQIIEDIFSNILCNTSNIEQTYLSNHTLESLYLPQEHGQNLESLLKLNKDTDNEHHAAIKKILQLYPNIDMEPLFEWGEGKEDEGTLKALPYVVDWFEKARVAVAEEEETYHIEEKKLSAIFQFTKAMPLLLEGIARYDTNESGGSGNKRKRAKRVA